MSDVLLWLGGNGAFNAPGKWNNVTTGNNPSLNAPGAADFAIITGSAGQVISGPGTAGFIEVLANTTFTGAFNAVGINEAGTDYLTTFQIRNNAAATFSTGATLSVTNENALIGHIEKGTLNLTGGADMTINVTDVTAAMYIGGQTANGSSVLVDGTGTMLTMDTGITVGLLTNAGLTVSNNATLSMGNENAFGFYIGYGGSSVSTFNLKSGAGVTNSGFTDIGTLTGSKGTVVVENAGTTWQDVSIAVGFSGTGSLTIQDKASVSTTSMSLGSLTGGDGALLLKDAGSKLTVSNDLAIGGALEDGGTGALTVQNSATAGITNTIRVWGDGTLNVLTGGTVNVGSPAGPVAGSLNIGAAGLVEGTGAINAAIVNNGVLQATDFNKVLADTAMTVTGGITGTGTIKLQGDATLDINGAVAATQTVLFDTIFAGADSTLNIAAAGASGSSATINGFDTGDKIRLSNTLGAQASFDTVTNLVTVKDFTGATVASLKLTDFNDGDTFAAFTDGAKGSYIRVDDGTNTGPPTIISGGGGATADIKIGENKTELGFEIKATDPDNDKLSYRVVGGADAALFRIADGDGVFFDLHFKTAANFENPLDAGKNNVYEVIVAAEDGRGGYDTQTVTVAVTNNPNPLNGDSKANILIGSDDPEKIFGFAGNDTLIGNFGNDVLTGGTGRDFMTGGGGLDDFDFNAKLETGKTAATRDRISDFKHGQDDIDLRTIDANSNAGGNQNFKFISTKAFTHLAGEVHVRYEGGGARTIVEGDVNGDSKADFMIELTGNINLSASDFIL